MMYTPYRSYLFFILLLYLLLICMLHTQLQMYDKAPPDNTPDVELKPQLRRSQKRLHPYNGRHGVLYNHQEQQDVVALKRRKQVYNDIWSEANKSDSKPLHLHKKYADTGHTLYHNPNRPPYSYNISDATHPSCESRQLFNQTFQPMGAHYLYSAYLDDRRQGPAYVRVVALLKRGSKPNFYCHFKNVVKSIPVVITYYEMCENHAKEYGGWLLSCEVPESMTSVPICDVTITNNNLLSTNITATLPVIVLHNSQLVRQDVGLCVPPLFGSIPSITLIEFIELSRLLGVDHVTFYDHQTSREINKVLDYYSNLGIATVMPWDLPVDQKHIWYHGQLLAINDCLYRQQHRFQYLAFNDIDEFIVPHQHTNWTTMIDFLISSNHSSPARLAGMSFQSAFFDPLLETNNRILFDLESDLRTKTFSKVRTKVLIRPENIFELGIHHISRTVAPHLDHIQVPPEVAFLHHYRKCITDFDPSMHCQVLSRDQSLTSLLPALRHNVHHILWTLKEIETRQHVT